MAYHLNGTYRLPKDYNPPIVVEFVEPNPSDHFIWFLFKHRCIICHKPATEINEIIPRSRSKKSVLDWKNRVTLCHEHHLGDNGFHHDGVTDKKIVEMRDARAKFLASIGRDLYL